MKPENKKPFGLQIASKIAAKALKNSNAPQSVVLANLLYLQKDTNFPKDLDESYFQRPIKNMNDLDKRIVAKLLDDIKRPLVNVAELLESTVESGWTKKSMSFPKENSKEFVPRKPNKTNTVKAKAPAAKVEPTIIIKRNKLVG